MFTIKKSKIHGKGVFSKKKISKGGRVGIGIKFNWIWFPQITDNLGKYINHSYSPNAHLEWLNNKWYITASKKIPKNTEITLNYNDTPWYITKPESHFK
jgi:SET domain-containing protein